MWGNIRARLACFKNTMIWLNELIKCKDNAPGVELRLQGEYNHAKSKNDPLIAINLIVLCEGANPIKKRIFSKNPAMLAYQEEPMAEDIYAKYFNNIEKFKQIINNKSLTDLMTKYKIILDDTGEG